MIDLGDIIGKKNISFRHQLDFVRYVRTMDDYKITIKRTEEDTYFIGPNDVRIINETDGDGSSQICFCFTLTNPLPLITYLLYNYPIIDHLVLVK